MIRRPRTSTLFPYTTLFRSNIRASGRSLGEGQRKSPFKVTTKPTCASGHSLVRTWSKDFARACGNLSDRKSTRLNSSHQIISYAVFCLKKKKNPKANAESEE